MDKIFQYGGVEAIPLYNCSSMSSDSWTTQFGLKRPVLGIMSIIYGAIFEILFIPCLWAMLEKELWRMSCYKIMFFVGIVDIFALAMNSISTGYLAYEGAVFCTHPVFIYITGLWGLGLWCCSCLMNILLLVNRTLNISNSNLSDYVFEGHRTYLVLLIPIIYGLYFMFFTRTCVFSSKYYAWFYDPFIFPDKSSESYQILYQSVAICFINQVSSSVYVIMNFISVPEWIIVFAQLLWQLDHGCPVIIYITINPTIRSGFWRKITFKKRRISSMQTTSIRPFPYRDV